MNRFGADDIRAFLTAVDAALEQRARIIVIGGSAAALELGIERRTQDIDTWTSVDADLARAVAAAREQTGLIIPFGQSGVADGPHDFEDRLLRVMPELGRLEVFVPEKHDLVLMKVVRGYEHDLETIEAIHRQSSLDLLVLVDRYNDEMGAVVIEPSRLRSNILVMVERLFPEKLKDVERQLRRTDRGGFR